MKNAQKGKHTQWILESDLLIRSVLSYKRARLAAMRVPEEKAACVRLSKVQLHSLTIDASLRDFSTQTFLQEDETGLLEPTHCQALMLNKACNATQQLQTVLLFY